MSENLLASADDAPPFDEPWQAQVMAMAFRLIDAGHFSNRQWSAALGEALVRASERGEDDDTATYYRAALEALESLLASSGSVSNEALSGRTEAWRNAYLRTPHGQPVVLDGTGD